MIIKVVKCTVCGYACSINKAKESCKKKRGKFFCPECCAKMKFHGTFELKSMNKSGEYGLFKRPD